MLGGMSSWPRPKSHFKVDIEEVPGRTRTTHQNKEARAAVSVRLME